MPVIGHVRLQTRFLKCGYHYLVITLQQSSYQITDEAFMYRAILMASIAGFYFPSFFRVIFFPSIASDFDGESLEEPFSTWGDMPRIADICHLIFENWNFTGYPVDGALWVSFLFLR